MRNKMYRKTQRGPLISSRQILTTAELEAENAIPWRMFAATTAYVTHDLMRRVGYQNKITVTIAPLPKEHPEAPGYEVAAKMRRL